MTSPMTRAWELVIEGLEIRHPNLRSHAVLRVSDADPPTLYVGLDVTWCTMTGEPKLDFAISNVKLTYWPGFDLAQKWLAAAWAGYCQHEALELVTSADDRAVKILDPHADPYPTNPVNRGLRDGFPVELTRESLIATLELVVPRATALEMVGLQP